LPGVQAAVPIVHETKTQLALPGPAHPDCAVARSPSRTARLSPEPDTRSAASARADVLICGAGICGRGAALLLARDGHDVTVIERDASALPETPQEAWDAWARKGIAQFRQPHNFMPGFRQILETELPDLQDALLRAG